MCVRACCSNKKVDYFRATEKQEEDTFQTFSFSSSQAIAKSNWGLNIPEVPLKHAGFLHFHLRCAFSRREPVLSKLQCADIIDHFELYERRSPITCANFSMTKCFCKRENQKAFCGGDGGLVVSCEVQRKCCDKADLCPAPFLLGG